VFYLATIAVIGSLMRVFGRAPEEPSGRPGAAASA
jgi:hypothetical protein